MSDRVFDENAFITLVKERIIENAYTYFESEDIGKCSVHLVPHPFRSDNPIYVFEIRMNSETLKNTILAKRLLPHITSQEAPKREYEMLKMLYENSTMVERRYFVPRPFDHFDDVRTILIEKVEGTKLTGLIREENKIFSRDSRTMLESFMKKCGDCLKIIHAITSTGKSVTLSSEIFHDLFHKIQTNYGYLIGRNVIVNRIRETFQNLIEKAREKIKQTEFPLVRQHGDYYLGNILVRGEDLIILDFSFTRENIIYHDLSRFLISLDFLNPYPHNFFFNFKNIHIFKKRFLEGYFAEVSDITNMDWLLLYLYNIKNILRHWLRRYDHYSSPRLKGRLYFSALNVIYNRKLREELEEITKLTTQ